MKKFKVYYNHNSGQRFVSANWVLGATLEAKNKKEAELKLKRNIGGAADDSDVKIIDGGIGNCTSWRIEVAK